MCVWLYILIIFSIRKKRDLGIRYLRFSVSSQLFPAFWGIFCLFLRSWVFTCSYAREKETVHFSDLTSINKWAIAIHILYFLQRLLTSTNILRCNDFSCRDNICSCISLRVLELLWEYYIVSSQLFLDASVCPLRAEYFQGEVYRDCGNEFCVLIKRMHMRMCHNHKRYF